MTQPTDDKAKALEVMLAYLERTLADELATTRDSDSKVNVRLTIFGGIVGLVTLALPLVGGARATADLRYATIASFAVFGFCLWRALSLALAVLSVRIELPGVAEGSFQRAARSDKVTSVKVLEELVQNYAIAVENNARLIEERKTPGTALKVWSKWTLATGFLALALSAIVYMTAGPKSAKEKESPMADEVKQQQQQTPPAPAPGQVTSSASDDQPSLLAAPIKVDLEKAAEPKPGRPLTFKEEPIRKVQTTDKKP